MTTASALAAGFPPSKLANKEGEVLTRPGGMGGRKERLQFIKRCLRRSLQASLNLIRCSVSYGEMAARL